MSDIMQSDAQARRRERIDSLHRGGLVLAVDPSAFVYGTDSVLLADFAASGIKKGERVCDLGAGTGVLPFLIGARVPETTFDAVEIQQSMCRLMERSIELNGWHTRLRVYNIDLNDAPARLGCGQYGAVVCNPPYGKRGHGIVPKNKSAALARFEVACTLDGIMRAAFLLLKNGGSLFMVHQTARLLEALDTARTQRLWPRIVRCVHPDAQKEAKHVLLRFVKGGECELRWQPPLILYDDNGEYTMEARRVYGGDDV